ncbi:MAG: RNA polymerase sigma factor [bacterium]
MAKLDYCDRHGKEWLEEWYAKYVQYAVGVAYQITREREAARDLAQEAFLRILEAMAEGRYARTAEFQTYLHRVVRNLSLNHVTRRKEIPFGHPPPGEAEDHTLYHRLERMDIPKILSILAPHQRKVFVLFYLQEKSYAEIAALLGIPEKSVGNILYCGKQKIWQFLKNNEE